MVRAKFVCTGVEKAGGVGLMAVYGDSEENKKFFQATPYGELHMGILNPDALSLFEVGKEYYIDFSKVE